MITSPFSIQDESTPLVPSGPRKSVDISFLNNGRNRQQYLNRWKRKNRWARVKAWFQRLGTFLYNNCLTFYFLHATYLTAVAFVGAIIIYIIEVTKSEPPSSSSLSSSSSSSLFGITANHSSFSSSEYGSTRVKFLDILFNCISAVTCTGLTTADVSKWSMGSIVVAYFVLELGSICMSTCLIVPFVRYRRVKALAQRRIDHIEARDAEEEYAQTDSEKDDSEKGSDSEDSEDDDLIPISKTESGFFGPSKGLTRTQSSVNFSRLKIPTVSTEATNQSTSLSASTKTFTTTTPATISSAADADDAEIPHGSSVRIVEKEEEQAGSALHTPSTVVKMHSSLALLSTKQASSSASLFTGAVSGSDAQEKPASSKPSELRKVQILDDNAELPSGARRLPKSLSKFRAFDERTKRDDSSTKQMSQPVFETSASALRLRSSKSFMMNAGGGTQVKNLPQNFLGLKYDYMMEQKALLQLSIVQLAYGILIQFIVMIGIVIAATYNDDMAEQIRKHNENKWWWGLFMAGSSTSNLGFCYWEEGLTEVKDIPPVTLILIFGVIAGNTCVPILVRFFVWIVRNLTPQRYAPKHAQPLRYVLKNPWRCSLHLFTSAETRVLLIVYVFLWTSVAAGYIGIKDTWGSAHEWVVAFFVSVSSRTSGFTIVDFSKLPSSFVLLVIGSMYIAAYPIAIMRKQTKVVRQNEDNLMSSGKQKRSGGLSKYWRAIFLSQRTWIYIFIVVIAFFEIGPTKPEMTLLSIVFEIVSAYGTVGYSFGLPGKTLALSGNMTPISKICVMITMMMGRNRGLPTHVYPEDIREGVKQEVVMANMEQ